MASFTRKYVLLLLPLMLLVSCIPAPSPTAIAPKLPTPSATIVPTAYPTPSATIVPTAYPWSSAERLRYVLGTLGIDVSCPHLCWHGINPGVTSAAEAHAILGTDLEKDSDDGYNAGSAIIENDLVKSIYIRSKGSGPIGLVFMSDFINVLGDPAEIRINYSRGMHCDPWTSYFVYYPSQKLTLFVRFSSPAGPRLDDYISAMILNSEFDNATFDKNNIALYSYYPLDRADNPFKRQPWLGFEHIRDYLPGQPLPAC